jgi:hypothetical protein
MALKQITKGKQGSYLDVYCGLSAQSNMIKSFTEIGLWNLLVFGFYFNSAFPWASVLLATQGQNRALS